MESPVADGLLGASVPLAIDTGSPPLRIVVLAVIVAAILLTRMGPRGR